MGLFKKKEIIDEETQKKTILENNRKRLVNEKTSFDVKESYKELRTNITFSLTKKGCKKIMVTGSVASEGKSTTCVNTAITFGEVGSRILLIDCDLRKPNVGKLFNIPKGKGLSNVLVGEVEVEDVIHQSEYPNLDVIFAGNIPPNPTELLSSDTMKSVIDELCKKYDYIFFDTPPVSIVTDAVLLSKMVDGVVVVSRQNYTERKLLAQSIEKLNFVGAKIIGIVLNHVEVSKKSYGKYGGKYASYTAYGQNR
jgi:capsular exopolysaccharide synthesis family protein